MRPLRLPVIWKNEAGFALDMPAGVQILPDNWYPRTPLLAESINYQAAQGKPEMQRLGIPESGATAIYSMEPDMSGVALFAFDSETAEFWRNAYGSEQFELQIEFIAERGPQSNELTCDLPIARHASENRVLISHNTGKKAFTAFRLLENIGQRFSRWEAKIRFYRMHQVFIHALECGIPILGDRQYARSTPLYLSSLKRGYRPSRHKEEAPLYDGCPLHLRRVTLPLPGGDTTTIEAPLPNKYKVLIKRLRDFG